MTEKKGREFATKVAVPAAPFLVQFPKDFPGRKLSLDFPAGLCYPFKNLFF